MSPNSLIRGEGFVSFEGTAFIQKEEGKYVARCPGLGVSSSADTMLEVLERLRIDVREFLTRDGQDMPPEEIHLSVMRVEVEL